MGHQVLTLGVTAWLLVGAAQAGRPVAATGVALALGVALSVGRRFPLAALVASLGALFAVDGVEGGRELENPCLLALVIASYLIGRRAALRFQPWAAAGVLLFLSANVDGDNTESGDIVFPLLMMAAPWVLGIAVALAERRAEGAHQVAVSVTDRRDAEVRRATDSERLRIAREMHDAVAHRLSTMTLQAQVARRRVEAGRPVEAADLAAIETSSRAALDDIRRILGILGPVGAAPEPEPGIGDLTRLVEECQATGHRVRLRSEGEAREVPPALATTVYRIVQEALTNARRHGLPGTTHVGLTWHAHALVIAVRNPASGELPPPGNGRIGMAERARLFGGRVETRVNDGWWITTAELPLPPVVAA